MARIRVQMALIRVNMASTSVRMALNRVEMTSNEPGWERDPNHIHDGLVCPADIGGGVGLTVRVTVQSGLGATSLA